MPSESMNSIAQQLLRAIDDVDQKAIRGLCGTDIELWVPGARDVDLTAQRTGVDGFCAWVMEVKSLCGQAHFSMHRYFENGCELMAAGTIHIERHPRMFSSVCSILLRFEAGKVVTFQLLVDTYALEKFRGQMD